LREFPREERENHGLVREKDDSESGKADVPIINRSKLFPNKLEDWKRKEDFAGKSEARRNKFQTRLPENWPLKRRVVYSLRTWLLATSWPRRKGGGRDRRGGL